MFVGKTRAFPKKPVSGRLWAYLQMLGEVIKIYQGKNTLAYYKNLEITAIKSFIVLSPGVVLTFSLSHPSLIF
jgi:hypothetical protein